jgi:hypothetical protein
MYVHTLCLLICCVCDLNSYLATLRKSFTRVAHKVSLDTNNFLEVAQTRYLLMDVHVEPAPLVTPD